MKKKVFILMMLVAIMASCGPHRMKCGARGICETPKKTISQTA